ncbi:MAG: hypothetical protein AB8H79_09035 [Myxococcota bacterium]
MRIVRPVLILATIATLAACNDTPEGGAVAIEPAEATTTDDLSVVISEAPTDKDELTYTYSWSVDGQSIGDLVTDTVPSDRTAKGQEWTVDVVADDGKVTSAPLSASVVIQNTAPEVTGATIAPNEPATGDDLVLSTTDSDIDNDTVTLAISWTVNGADAGITDTTIPAAETEKGDVWVATIEPSDGETTGLTTEVSVTIGNTAPVADGVILSPGVVTEATVLNATPTGSDVDGDEVTWTYVWYVAGGEVKRSSDATLDGVSFDKGDTVLVQAIPNDGVTDGNTVTSNEVTVSGTVPTIASVRIDPTEATEATELVCVADGAADVDGDAISFTTTWTVDGTALGELATLNGDQFNKDDDVVCTMRPEDEDGIGLPVSSAALTISNSPPEILSLGILPGSPNTTTNLDANVMTTSDPDGDLVTSSHEWSVGGTTTVGPTLQSSNFEKGDVVTLTSTPNDGTDDGVAVSTSVTIGNAPPTAPVPSLGTGFADPADDLQCEIATASTDADGDSITYTITWTQDGTAWTGATSTTTVSGDTIDASDTAKGEVWACSVTASDGTDTSPAGVASTNISTCGDSSVTGDEEYDPAPGPFTNVTVDSTTCRWDFSAVEQLYCNGSCTWAGTSGCDAADADLFCQLRTGNPSSKATSYTSTTALAKPGFSCPSLGTTVNVNGRGVTRVVKYQDSSIRANHGAGDVIANPVCTNP